MIEYPKNVKKKTEYKLQPSRLFFWWQPCKLPSPATLAGKHWFEWSKLQPARASRSAHFVPRGCDFVWFQKCFKRCCLIVKIYLRVFMLRSYSTTTTSFRTHEIKAIPVLQGTKVSNETVCLFKRESDFGKMNDMGFLSKVLAPEPWKLY